VRTEPLQTGSGSPDDAVHSAILHRVLEAWDAAGSGPYSSAYLFRHATLASTAGALVEHIGFLLTATRESLQKLAFADISGPRLASIRLIAASDHDHADRPIWLAHAGHLVGDQSLAALTPNTSWQLAASCVRIAPQLATLSGHSGRVYDIDLITRGGETTIASASGDGTIGIWTLDVDSPPHFVSAHDEAILAVSIALVGTSTIMISGGQDGKLKKWDLDLQTQLGENQVQDGGIAAVLTAASGGTCVIISAGQDGKLRKWDIDLEEQLAEADAHDDEITAIALFVEDDTNIIISGGLDGKLRKWDIDLQEKIAEIDAHDDGITAIALTTEHNIISGGLDGKLKRWDIGLQEKLAEIDAHDDGITAIAAATIGKTNITISGGMNGSLSSSDDNERQSSTPGHEGTTRALVRLNQDDEVQGFLTCGDDRTIRLWPDEIASPRIDSRGHRDWVRSVLFADLRDHGGGEVLLSAGGDGRLLQWSPDLQDAAPLDGKHDGWVRHLAHITGTAQVASAGRDGFIGIWDLDSRSRVRSLQAHGEEGIWCVLFDGSILITCGADGFIRFWDPSLEEVRSPLFHEGGVRFATNCSVEDDLLFTAGADGSIKRWPYSEGAVAPISWVAHGGDWITSLTITEASFSDAPLLISGGDDGNAHIWSADSGRHIGTFSGHTHRVRATAAMRNPTDDTVAVMSLGGDMVARIWSLATQLEISRFPLFSLGESIACAASRHEIAVASSKGVFVYTPPNTWLDVLGP